MIRKIIDVLYGIAIIIGIAFFAIFLWYTTWIGAMTIVVGTLIKVVIEQIFKT